MARWWKHEYNLHEEDDEEMIENKKAAPAVGTAMGGTETTYTNRIPENAGKVKLPIDRMKSWYADAGDKARAIREMVEVYGHTATEIRAALGVDAQQDPRLYWDKPHVEQLLELYSKGLTHQQIADEMGVSKGKISSKLKQLQAHGAIPARADAGQPAAQRQPMLELLAAIPGQMVRAHTVCEIAGERYAVTICRAGGDV